MDVAVSGDQSEMEKVKIWINAKFLAKSEEKWGNIEVVMISIIIDVLEIVLTSLSRKNSGIWKWQCFPSIISVIQTALKSL